MISRWFRFGVSLTAAILLLVALLAARGARATQFIVSTNTGDFFRSLGVDTNGMVFISGSRAGTAILFHLSGNSIVATLLAQFPDGDSIGATISRDAQYAVSTSYTQAVLWIVSNPGVVQGLGVPAGRSGSSALGVSSGPNPTVVGFTGTGSFVWTSASGMQAFTNPPGHFAPNVTGISSNGLTTIGYAGAGPQRDGFVCHGNSFSFHDELGGLNSQYYAIAPSANIVGGEIDGQGTIWNEGVGLRLTVNGNPVNRVVGITDSSFAVGSATNGGYIYDPRTGVTSLFDAWWQHETSNAVPHHVTSVNDVYEANGLLYFALGTTNGAALAVTIAPPQLEVLRPTGGLLRIRFQSVAGASYQFLASPTLPATLWDPAANGSFTGNGVVLEFQAPLEGAARFFRLQITSP